MLLELAIGDAYGAGFEYADAAFVAAHNDGRTYVRNEGHIAKTGGFYTDDTQMSLAVAEAIVSGDPWTPLNLADGFVRAFHRDPRTGYSRGFHAFLRKTRSGAAFLANMRPDSDRSGAAMRAAPIGVFGAVDEVIDRATAQARLTHDTPDGIAAAVAAALLAHYCLYDLGPKAEAGRFLERHVPGHRWSEPRTGWVGEKGWMSVRAAVTALAESATMTALLRRCVAFGGDVDTVASIALAAAAHSAEITQDLPASLIDGLEDGRYGRGYIQELDRRLMEGTKNGAY